MQATTTNITHKTFPKLPNLDFIGVVENGVLVVYGITDERTNKAYLTGFGLGNDFRAFGSGYYLLINEMAYVTVGYGTLEAIDAMEHKHETENLDRLSERDMREILGSLFYDDDHVH